MAPDGLGSPGRKVKVLIAADDRETITRLREAFGMCSEAQAVGVASDSIEAAQMAVSLHPDVVVVDRRFDGDGLHVCGVLNRISPHMKVILLVEGINEDTVLTAARAGAREVLDQSFEPQEFIGALGRMTESEMQSIGRDYQLAVNPEAFPRIIVVTSAKGGAGTTSIAVNLAVCLAASDTGKTVLLDCNPTFSDSRTMLDVRVPRGLADLMDEWEVAGEFGLDPNLLEQCISHSSLQVDVVAAASPNLGTALPTSRVIARAQRTLKRFYRYIVVDTPAEFVVGREPALPSYWRMFVVVNLNEVTLLQNTKRLLERLGEEYGIDERLNVVVNKHSRGNEFTIKDLQSALGLTEFITIPEDNTLRQACNLGKPVVVENPRAPAARVLYQISEKLIEEAKYTVASEVAKVS